MAGRRANPVELTLGAPAVKLIHIAAGFLALGAGAVALYSLKGGTLHRKGGAIFVYAMLVMAGLGAVIAALKPDRLSAMGGVLACYMVTTTMLTVRRRAGEEFHWLNHAAMLVALAVGMVGIKFGFDALDSTTGRLDAFPAAMYFIFGAIALLAGLLDIRMLLARDIQGKHRIARHLWRVGFAMFMAYGSFFLGQAKLFPEPVRQSHVLAVPVLLVVVTTLYWLVRVLIKQRQPRVLDDSLNPKPISGPAELRRQPQLHFRPRAVASEDLK